MCFDNIKSCGQIFSAVVLLGDFNGHFNHGDILSPSTDMGDSDFNFLKSNYFYSWQVIQHELFRLGNPFST